MKTVNILTEFEENSLKAEGEDIINFAQPLAITDDSRQWNMTKYDIDSLDISKFDGTVTADHGQTISDVIGKVINLRKEGNRILIDGIKFAIKENPLAVLAKNLMKSGFVRGVSIETIGDEADDTLTWHNHKLAGLSVVAHPNNTNAYAVIANSIKEAKELGLQTNKLELLVENKGGNPYHAKDGKFTTGSGNISKSTGREHPIREGSVYQKSLEAYEKAKTMYDNIDSSQQKGSKEEKEYLEAKEHLKDTYDILIDAYKDLDRPDRIEWLQEQKKLLDESPSQKFEREKSETIPSLSKADKAHLEKLKKSNPELEKKMDEITKKFGNSISEQVQDNSNRLTTILNAQSKGNPYHDKEGKFTSGPSAFGKYRSSKSQEFGHVSSRSISELLDVSRAGDDDTVFSKLSKEMMEATYESAVCANNVSNLLDVKTEKMYKPATMLMRAGEDLLKAAQHIANASQFYSSKNSDVRKHLSQAEMILGKTLTTLKSVEPAYKAGLKDSSKDVQTDSVNIRDAHDALMAVNATLDYIKNNFPQIDSHDYYRY